MKLSRFGCVARHSGVIRIASHKPTYRYQSAVDERFGDLALVEQADHRFRVIYDPEITGETSVSQDCQIELRKTPSMSDLGIARV
jgi:hypothetical protein